MTHRNWIAGLLGVLAMASTAAAQSATPEQALKLVPVQKDVAYDVPEPAEVAQCTIKAERTGTGTGWVVRDAAGVVLRRFIDSNGDDVVDTWCYYQNGIEVYRDIDSTHNGKADQHRWLNTAGSRWALDNDEDGRIDSWKAISAEEVTAEVVAALRQRDAERFARLLLTAEELKSLGLSDERTRELAQKLGAAKAQFAAVARQAQGISPKTVWLHFGGTQPGLVPAGTDGSTKDLLVYENVTCLVETDGKHGQVRIGTLAQVGSVWRLIEAPSLVDDGDAAAAGEAGNFFRTSLAKTPETTAPRIDASDEKLQKLLAELEALDKATSNNAALDVQIRAHEKRGDILEQLAEASSDPKDKAQWLQQLADTLSVAAQSGGYAKGVERLKELQEKVAADGTDPALAAYVKFRYLTADYGLSLQSPKADFAKIQTDWLKNLKEYVNDYPKSPDAAEALLQLAIAEEFAGQEDAALVWYRRIVTEFPSAAPAKKAAGAITRLDSVGKPIRLAGATTTGGNVNIDAYRGKVVLVHYWATWCEPCLADLAKIKELYAKYGRAGFAPIGVNLDTSRSDAVSYLEQHKLPWPQLYEPGSLDGRLANELGILTLPTMLLLDRKGRVVNRNIHATELENEVKKYLDQK
jgi:thiol-disulfide isomerase/thioredoxin